VVGFVAVAEIVLVSTSLSLYNNKLGGGVVVLTVVGVFCCSTVSTLVPVL
jgi:hypothetical protein